MKTIFKCAVYHSNEWYTLTAEGYQTFGVSEGCYALIPEVASILNAPIQVAKMFKTETTNKGE